MTSTLLQQLADKQALDELIYRQALALDRHDWKTYRRCMADGAVHFDFTEHTDRVVGKHIGVETSADRWVEKAMAVMAGFEGTQHMISNTLHVVEGDHAKSECFILADHFLANDRGGPSFTMGGIYSFESIRAVDGWRINRWHLKILWYRGNPTVYEAAAERVRARAASTSRSG